MPSSAKISNFAVKMKEVAQYIERLLLQNDCVIVPGLGGFVAQDCEACYVKEENVFLPPYRCVSFNQRLSMNDGLLAHEYARCKHVSFPEAQRIIECQVSELREMIARRGHYHIPGVGTLNKKNGGSYEFVPLACGIDSPEHFGLDCLDIPMRHDSDEVIPTIEIKTHEEQIFTVNIRKNIVRYAAAIAIAAVFFIIGLMPIRTVITTSTSEANFFKTFLSAFVHNKATDSNGEIAIIQGIEKSNPTAISQKSITTAPSPAERKVKAHYVQDPATKIKETPKPYTIILASAITIEGAQRMVDDLKRNGLNDASVVTRRGMIRVIYGNYANSAEASQTLQTVRSRHSAFDQAWIYAF